MDPKTLADLRAADRAHLFHPSTHMRTHAAGESPNRIVVGGEGATIIDAEGNRLLDGFAGLYCVNIGYGRPEMAQAVARQMTELAYYHAYVGHGSAPAAELSARVMEWMPANMRRIYYGLSGSDANETQLKLIRYFWNIEGRPEKKKIIARHRAYHGSGIMTGSLTGLEVFHKPFDLPEAPILHVATPHFARYGLPDETERDYARRLAADLDAFIQAEGPDTVAAFFAEPVMGTGGILPPPKGYFDEIVPVLRRHDVLFVADEVVTAFGRLGAPCGALYYGFEPDLITVAKGMTSAYLPLSGAVVSERVWATLERGSDALGPIGHGWTYSAHPTCAAAGLANLAILRDENLMVRAGEAGRQLLSGLRDAFDGLPGVFEVRGEGLLAAVEFGQDTKGTPFEPSRKVGPRIAAVMAEDAVIARALPHGDILAFAPPFVIAPEEIERLVSTARRAAERVLKEEGALAA